VSRARLPSLLLGLLLLNLNRTAAAPSCAATPSAPAPSHEGMPMDHHQAPDKAPSAPRVPVCCQALASCSVTLEGARVVEVAIAAIETTPPVDIARITPSSVSVVPDPPPPRA
jgi:hypothetical protein